MIRDRLRGRYDSGMTLVEVLVTSTILVILLGMVLASINVIETIDGSVTAQYQEYDQVAPALAPIRTLVASEVEPAPVTSGGVPTPAFQYPLGSFAATWTANIGTEYDNVVGASACSPSCTAGPAQIVAGEYTSGGTPVESSATGPNSVCSTASPCSFQVRMYLPELSTTDPGVSTCPVPVDGNTATGAKCTWSTTYKLVADIHDVVNNPNDVDGSGNPLQPIFTYSIIDPDTSAAFTLTPAMLNSSPQTLTGLPASYPSSSEPLATCTGTTGLTCPLDDIQSVTIHLIVNESGSGANGEVENQIIEYRYPQSADLDACYPYQYSSQCNPYAS